MKPFLIGTWTGLSFMRPSLGVEEMLLLEDVQPVSERGTGLEVSGEVSEEKKADLAVCDDERGERDVSFTVPSYEQSYSQLFPEISNLLISGES